MIYFIGIVFSILVKYQELNFEQEKIMEKIINNIIAYSLTLIVGIGFGYFWAMKAFGICIG